MGGDYAPANVVRGAVDAFRERRGEVTVVLVGQEPRISAELGKLSWKEEKGLEIVHASEVVEMHDSPNTALKAKKDSSIVVGVTLHRNGKGGDLHVFLSLLDENFAVSDLDSKRIQETRKAWVRVDESVLCEKLFVGGSGFCSTVRKMLTLDSFFQHRFFWAREVEGDGGKERDERDTITQQRVERPTKQHRRSNDCECHAVTSKLASHGGYST